MRPDQLTLVGLPRPAGSFAERVENVGGQFSSFNLNCGKIYQFLGAVTGFAPANEANLNTNDLPQAMIWFFATASSIFAPFAIVEKFSSKEDLEDYYLLITVKRFKFSAQWYLLVIKFVDLFFGFHKVYGKLMVPSVLRVAVYTICINAIIWSPVIIGNSPYEGGAWFALTIPGNLLFDYFNFLKTRYVLEFVAKHRTFISIVFGIFVEIIFLILLCVVSIFITYEFFKHVFFPDRDNASLALAVMIAISFNTITAALSTIIIMLFVVATIASHVANYISVIQQFLDRHTAVLENPIQTLGAMAVVLFAVLFWTWFGLYQLVGSTYAA